MQLWHRYRALTGYERKELEKRMLFYMLWDDGGGFQTYDAGLDYLRAPVRLR